MAAPTRRALLAAAATATAAQAQTEWPGTRPVALTIPYGPGGGTDILGRIAAQALAERTGGSFVMDHKPGGATTVAARHVARARPDGMTLLMGSVGTFTFAPFAFRNLGYDPLRDFEHITQIAETILILVANPRWESLEQAIAAARRRPGELSFATWGVGSSSHLLMVDMMARAGIELIHVPYNSTPPALTDTVAGRTDMMFSPLATAKPHVESGRLRGLAMIRATRVAVLPQVPTIDEAGMPGLRTSSWLSLEAPAGTPAPILVRIEEIATQAFQAQANRALLDGLGMASVEFGSAALRARIEAELPRHRELMARAGVQPE